MQMNNKMKLLYDKIESNKKLKIIYLNSILNQLVMPGFIKTKNAVLLRTQKKLTKVKPDIFPDLTGYECFVNHVHIEDYIDETLTKMSLLKQGILFANRIKETLNMSFPSKEFNIVISLNRSNCVVRFHQIRSGEEWLSNDLEEYQQEAIMVIKTGKQ